MGLKETLAAEGLRLIAITPLELRTRVWVCIGFEEIDASMGDFPHLMMIYAGRDWLTEHDLAAAVADEFGNRESVLTRVHSECLLGESFGSTMCDCASQMRRAQDEVEARGRGAIIYLRQEGRGIGMRNKLDVLALQYGFERGARTAPHHSSDEANVALGLPVDAREYNVAAAAIRGLGIQSVQLITGNPQKIADLREAGVPVISALDTWTEGLSARAAAELEEKIARGYVYQREGATADTE